MEQNIFKVVFPQLAWYDDECKNCGKKFWTSHKVYLSLNWSDCHSVVGYCVVQFIENKRLQMMEMALCWVLAFITRDFPFNSDGWDLISTFNKKKKIDCCTLSGWLLVWCHCVHHKQALYGSRERRWKESFYFGGVYPFLNMIICHLS